MLKREELLWPAGLRRDRRKEEKKKENYCVAPSPSLSQLYFRFSDATANSKVPHLERIQDNRRKVRFLIGTWCFRPRDWWFQLAQRKKIHFGWSGFMTNSKATSPRTCKLKENTTTSRKRISKPYYSASSLCSVREILPRQQLSSSSLCALPAAFASPRIWPVAHPRLTFAYLSFIRGKHHLHWEPFWIWRPSDGCHLMNSPFDGFFTPSYLILFVDCRHSSSKNWYDKGRIMWWSLIFSWRASLTI